MGYSRDFYLDQMIESEASARVIAPMVLRLVAARSVVDVGCGVGTWLAAFREAGVAAIEGIDGAHVPRELLRIPVEAFTAADLERPLPPGPRADLALCLEVAEHLAPERAEGLVNDLVNRADAVLFSAALPFQGGEGHVNENWLEYWAILFRRYGFSAADVIRPALWNDLRVCWWYRQNIVLFARNAALGRAPFTDRMPMVPSQPRPLSQIHPAQVLTRLAQPRDPLGDDDRKAGLRYYTAVLDAYLAGGIALPEPTLCYTS